MSVFTQSTYKSFALEHDDTIRILTLYHGDDNEPLEGSLQCGRLSEVDGCYDTLSYTWGDVVKTESITLNGKDFKIGLALYRFLRAIRRLDKSLLLWTDAICINQASDSEKGHQVRMMGQIYAHANRTLAWLGEDPRDAKALRVIGLMIKEKSENGFTHTTKEEFEDRDHEQVKRQRYRLALRRIGQHRYWTRAWIYQELILAPTIDICCRNQMIPWTPLSDLASLVDDLLMDDEPRPFQDILWSIRSEQRRDLFDLLDFSSVSGCSILRDRVFALFSLIRDSEDPLSVDWSQNGARKGQVSARASQLVDYTISSEELFVKIVQLYCERGEPWDRTDFAMPLFKALDLHERCFKYEVAGTLDVYANIFRVNLQSQEYEWGFSFTSLSGFKDLGEEELHFIFAVSAARPHRIKAVRSSHERHPGNLMGLQDCWDPKVMNSVSAITSPVMGPEVQIRLLPTMDGSSKATLKLTLEWLRVICKLKDVVTQHGCQW